jgi:hypothetical protein
MNNIQIVFEKFLEINNNILICLDDTFCFAKSPESKPKNYISITSISDKEEVIECLKEEGSSVINFKISAKGKLNTNITKVVNSFVCILVENSFEPFMFSLLSNEVIVSIVISDTDIRIDDSDYDSQDSQTDYENDNTDIEKSDDDNDIEKSDDDNDIEKSDDDNDIEKSDDDDIEKSDDDDNDIEKSDDDDIEKSDDDEIEKSDDDDIEKSDDDDIEKSDDDDIEKSDDEKSDVEKNENVEINNNNKKIPIDINEYIQSIKNSTKQIDKLKRPELIEHLYVLGVKKIHGEYLRTCTKESLLKKLNEVLKK